MNVGSGCADVCDGFIGGQRSCGTVAHLAERMEVVSWLSVASQYTPLYLSTWFGGKAKVTVRWRVLGWLTTLAMLLALARLVWVQCAIGCVPVGGLDA